MRQRLPHDSSRRDRVSARRSNHERGATGLRHVEAYVMCLQEWSTGMFRSLKAEGECGAAGVRKCARCCMHWDC